MNQDQELWKPEDWYPPICPPKRLKKELLRDEDFTEVDMKARAAPSSLKINFSELVQHLTGRLKSDLHKLRSIFVWMGANKVGTQEDTECWENDHSPYYYLMKAYTDQTFVDKLFAKMCRCARIPCILVNGKAKNASYDPGDDDIKGENIWAVVYVASSWRFVFPYWAFVKASGHQKENWMLVEDCGRGVRTRFTASKGNLIPDLDEFFFLTDPNKMKYICHPNDKEMQLLTEPWTKEKFFKAPFFKTTYFSSGWHLISPSTCLIKAKDGCCSIDVSSPRNISKLKYQLYFDESRSNKIFPQEIQTNRYVIRVKHSPKTESVVVRVPEIGTYKLELTGADGGNTYSLAKFRIDCDYVAPQPRPFPSYPEDGFGFGEAAARVGVSQPSITEGIVPVNSGQDVSITFNVQYDVNISAKLVHCTRSPEDLQNYVTVSRERTNTTVTARLPADDPTPEYSLEVDVIKTYKLKVKDSLNYNRALNYLLTSDRALTEKILGNAKKQNLQFFEEACTAVAKDDAVLLEKAASRVKMAGIEDPLLDQRIGTKQRKYQRMRDEMLAAARDRDLGRLNKALEDCTTVNLQYRADLEYGKKVLVELHKEEDDKKILLEIDELQESKRMAKLLTDKDLTKMLKPPDDVVNILLATFILLGERKANVDTWHKIWVKLKKTNVSRLFAKLGRVDDSVLTEEQVDLAQDKLQQCTGSLGNDKVYKVLYSWCSDRVKSYHLRKKLTRINLPMEVSEIQGQEERFSPLYMTRSWFDFLVFP